ncbi:MAG TPA: TolC family protein [Flavobacteriaceae bacterium]|nr:TolC family protein [Flavobacteriaceae bacterium]
MNYKFITAILLLFGFSLTAQEKKWTLRECVNYALQHNISIQQSELDLKAAKIDKSDAIGNYLPSINANASLAWNTGLTQNVTTGVLQNQTTRNFSTGATAGLSLFEGLRNLRTLQRAKMSRVAAEYSLNKMKEDIALFVANAYLEVLVNKETLKILQEQNLVTQQQLSRTQDLVDAGVVPTGDLLQIKATNASEHQQIIAAENMVKISLINLAQILLIQDYENFQIADPEFNVPVTNILDKSVYEIIEVAKEEKYEVKIAEQNLELAKKDIQIAKSNYYPSLTGFFNYNARASNNDSFGSTMPFMEQLYTFDGISYGLQLNIPVLNGFSVRNSVQRSKINVMRTEYNLQQAKLDLESNVYQAYVDAKGAKEAYEAARVAFNAQQLAYDYASERYDVGLSNSFELSESKFRLTNAESQLIQAKYDYIFKIKVLELYFGIPISELKL